MGKGIILNINPVESVKPKHVPKPIPRYRPAPKDDLNPNHGKDAPRHGDNQEGEQLGIIVLL